ncbi:MAG: histidinol phosphate phosphatase domain-containing protein [Verrucomicrobia bacterium]|nr:histidinol phosphate phosphatase domain-containing protein [Verrucomicrobiota bacterium]
MIDLHTHTILSDGELIASELVRRAQVAGYTAIGITDHADASNLEWLAETALRAAQALNAHQEVTVIPGVELTHVPPSQIEELVARARALGLPLVCVHGQTTAEPVAPGTNRAALQCDIDILAHPGLITEADARLAAERGVCLELSARQGHCLTNGHVARRAIEAGAKLVVNTDSHDPGDLLSEAAWRAVALGAGLTEAQAAEVAHNSEALVEKLTGPSSRSD